MKSNTAILKELYDKQIFDLDPIAMRGAYNELVAVWIKYMQHHCSNLFIPVYLFQITEEKGVKKIYL